MDASPSAEQYPGRAISEWSRTRLWAAGVRISAGDDIMDASIRGYIREIIERSRGHMKAEELVRQIEEKLGTVTARPAVANVGRVVGVADGIVKADGLSRAGYGEQVEFEDGRRGLVMNLDEDFASILVLSEDTDIPEGMEVRSTGHPALPARVGGSPGPGHRPVRRAAGRQAAQRRRTARSCRWSGSPRGSPSARPWRSR